MLRLLANEELNRLPPQHGSRHLTDQRVACAFGIPNELGIYVAYDGYPGIGKVCRLQERRQSILCRLHQRAMEGCTHLQQDGLFCAALFSQNNGTFDPGYCSGNNGLLHRVPVGSGDHRIGFGSGVLANLYHVSLCHTENRGHGALACRYGFLHITTTAPHCAHGIDKAQGAGRHVRGILPQRVPRDVTRLHSVPGEHPQGGDRNGEDGGLSKLRQAELILRPVKTKLRQAKSQGLIGLFENLAGNGKMFVEVATHAYGLRALSGKKKRQFVCRHADAIQVINP